MYKKPKEDDRNFDNIQHADLRQIVDHKFNEVHDELSDCYYNKKPFSWKGKDYGVLDKETFDKLHGLIFDLREVSFHEENKKQPKEKQIPEEQYNPSEEKDGKQKTRIENVKDKVASLKSEGLELTI